MGWDDQLEAELKRFQCPGFKEGFAGRTMEALNRSILMGTPYRGPGMESCISNCFFKFSVPAVLILVIVLFLNFGIEHQETRSVTEDFAQSQIEEEETLEEWLESLGDQIIAGAL